MKGERRSAVTGIWQAMWQTPGGQRSLDDFDLNAAGASMKNHHVTGISDDVVVGPESVRIMLDTADGPMALTLPLATAEGLLVRLRASADDAHRLRQDMGDPLGKAIVSADRPPLDTVGCVATVVKDGRILLQFRHSSAASTALLVSQQGAAILAKALADLAGVKQPVSSH